MINRINTSVKQIINKIEELIAEGNLRNIIIRDSNGEKYIEIPLIIGAIGTIAAPIATIIGTIAGYAAKFTIEIIKKDSHEIIEINQLKNKND